MSEVIPWTIAGLSLISTIISIGLNYRSAELNRKKDVLSANRVIWINTLRNCVAEFVSQHMINHLITSQEEPKDRLTRLHTMTLLIYKIQLMLNPEEDSYSKLTLIMRQMNGLSMDRDVEDGNDKYQALVDDLVRETQAILKTEWERVKKLQ